MKKLKCLIVAVILLCLAMFVVTPVIACDECGRDGPHISASAGEPIKGVAVAVNAHFEKGELPNGDGRSKGSSIAPAIAKAPIQNESRCRDVAQFADPSLSVIVMASVYGRSFGGGDGDCASCI